MNISSAVLLSGLLFGCLITEITGCHDPRHARRKRQASTSSEVELTQALRDYFVACMRDGLGGSYNWESVVDYTVLDTNWYGNSEAAICGVGLNDTVECWQARLYNYIKHDSAAIERAKQCISQYSIDIQQGSDPVVYRSRSRRGIRPPTEQKLLIQQYAKCVESKVGAFPSNRRRLNFPSLLEFISEEAICGDCNIGAFPLLGTGELSRSKRSSGNDYNSSQLVTLIESLVNTYVAFTPSLEDFNPCSPIAVFPFRFSGLTQSSSPLTPAITQCNLIYTDILIPDPCDGLKNNNGDGFCNAQRSWCNGSYAAFMSINCEKTCCSVGADTLKDPPMVGWSDWTPWGACPAPCDQTAMQTRTRDCPLGRAGVDPCLGNTIESRMCQSLLVCPGWSEWGTWSRCSATCGGFVFAEASRHCGHPTGNCEGSRLRTRACKVPQCEGIFTQWSMWSQCSTTCGGGVTIRTRQCLGYSSCKADMWGKLVDQSRVCSQQTCPGRWDGWTSWSPCAVTCGSATASQFRSRTCVGGPPGGPGCPGRSQEAQPCGRNLCPPPQWSIWSSWSECTWKRRTRVCVGGAPGSGTCVGKVEEYFECDQGCRPTIPGGQDDPNPFGSWLAWSPWSTCSTVCGIGSQTRTRMCPAEQGRCSGTNLSSRTCFRSICFQ